MTPCKCTREELISFKEGINIEEAKKKSLASVVESLEVSETDLLSPIYTDDKWNPVVLNVRRVALKKGRKNILDSYLENNAQKKDDEESIT